MNRIFFTALIVCIAAIISCQSDSDYLVGSYDVITIVKSSSCPVKYISESLDNAALPSGFLAGQTRTMHWSLRRVGITGTGAHKVSIVLHPADLPDITLVLTGSMENEIIRIGHQQNISEEIYRFILLYGLIDGDHFIGEIRTFLSNVRNSPPFFESLPPNAPCETHEEFAGRRSPR